MFFDCTKVDPALALASTRFLSAVRPLVGRARARHATRPCTPRSCAEDGNRCARGRTIRGFASARRGAALQRCRFERYDWLRRSLAQFPQATSLSRREIRSVERRRGRTRSTQTGSLTLFTNFSQRTVHARASASAHRETATQTEAQGQGESGTRSRGDRDTSGGATSRTCSTANTPATNPRLARPPRPSSAPGAPQVTRRAIGPTRHETDMALGPGFQSAIFAQDRTSTI